MIPVITVHNQLRGVTSHDIKTSLMKKAGAQHKALLLMAFY